MTDRPDGEDLLEIARSSLLNELLPHLPEAVLLDARMIANAMAVALREKRMAAQQVAAEMQGLRGLYEEAADTGDLTWRFIDDIRAGRFDRPGAMREAARAHLRRTAVAKLELWNPKYLPGKKETARDSHPGRVQGGSKQGGV